MLFYSIIYTDISGADHYIRFRCFVCLKVVKRYRVSIRDHHIGVFRTFAIRSRFSPRFRFHPSFFANTRGAIGRAWFFTADLRDASHRRHPINSAVHTDNGQIYKQCCKANKLVRSHTRTFSRKEFIDFAWKLSQLSLSTRVNSRTAGCVSLLCSYAFAIIDVTNNDKINEANRAYRQRALRERLRVSLLIFPMHRDYRYLPVLSDVIEFSRALTRRALSGRTENALRRVWLITRITTLQFYLQNVGAKKAMMSRSKDPKRRSNYEINKKKIAVHTTVRTVIASDIQTAPEKGIRDDRNFVVGEDVLDCVKISNGKCEGKKKVGRGIVEMREPENCRELFVIPTKSSMLIGW